MEGMVNNLLDDPHVKGVVINSRDVTSRVRAEEKIRELAVNLGSEVAERTARLEKSEQYFRLTFELAPVGMAQVGLDGRWLMINDKLLEIVGYEREELLGLTFQDLTHPDHLDEDVRHAGRLLTGEIATYSTEKRYIKKDGSRVWGDLTVSLRRDLSGEPEYFISIVEDVTERKLRELVPEPLTRRELKVLGLVAQRKTNLQIARDLAYSLATVKLDVRRITAKLGGSDRHQAAARAVEIGLITPPR